MDCLACGIPNTRVGKSLDDGGRVRRKRTCECGAVFFSDEMPDKKTLRIATNGHGKPAVASGGQQAPPAARIAPSAATGGQAGGVGGDLPSGPSVSGSGSPSGPYQPPDLRGDRPPARETEPDPDDIRLPPGQITAYVLARVFGRVRGREWPGALSWTIPQSTPGKAEGIVTAANDDPDVRDDLIPTMALLFAKAKAGELGSKGGDATVAFGWWVSKFTALREELHGVTVAPRANGHDPRIGHARAEVKPRTTGEVDL